MNSAFSLPYPIFYNVRYLVKSALGAINVQDTAKTTEELTLALNAMGAFVDIQNMFDAQPGRMQFEKPEDIYAVTISFKYSGFSSRYFRFSLK